MRQAFVNLSPSHVPAGFPVPLADDLMALSEYRRYPDGAQAVAQGEPMPGVHVVARGALKVFRTDGRAKVQVIEILRAGGCLGEVEAMDGSPAYCGAEALGPTECWLIHPGTLKALAARDAQVANWLLQRSAERIRQLIFLVETLSLHTVPERIAHLILERQGPNPARGLVEFAETQEHASQSIGASREAFSRGLRTLADLRLIKNSFPVVRILDAQSLRRYAMGWDRGFQAAPGGPVAVGFPSLGTFPGGPMAAPGLLRATAN